MREPQPRPKAGLDRTVARTVGGSTPMGAADGVGGGRPAPGEGGDRRRWRGSLVRSGLIGPAVIAAVAYVDPGNFATNFAAGSAHGYRLLWVVVLANLMGMVVQYLAAKLGTVTGRSMPELIRDGSPPWVSRAMWLQAEIVAVATDLAEVIGGALALNLLFGVPILIGVLITGVVGLVVLSMSGQGRRRFEYTILGFLAVILIGLGYGLLVSGFSPPGAAEGLVPAVEDRSSLILATGILGATLMPHVVYLHSGLPQQEPAGDLPVGLGPRLRRHRINVVVAMLLAGAVNAAMLLMAAGMRRHSTVATGQPDDLGEISAMIGSVLGPVAAVGFGVALLASGLASTSVGTYAGQVIMQGFLRRRIPVLVRRCVTLVPAVVLLLLGTSPTQALIGSQVVLSFGIPFAVVPLIRLTSSRRWMGEHRNGVLLTTTAVLIGAAAIGLNGWLVLDAFL